MDNSKRKIGFILNIIISILLVAMVCLFIVYLFSFENTSDYELSKEMVLSIREGNAKVKYQKLFDSSYVLPQYLVVCSKNEDMALIGYKDEMKNNYDNIKYLMRVLCIDDNFAQKLSSEESQLYYANVLSGDGLIVKWNNPLPIEIISSMNYPYDQYGNLYKGIILQKIFIYSSKETLEGLFFDASGDVYVFRMKYSSIDDNPYYAIYNNIDKQNMLNIKFAYELKKEDAKYLGFSDDEMICDNVKLKSIICEYYNRDTVVYNTKIFDNLGINLAKASIYAEVDGSIIFMQEGRTLRIYKNGKIEYVSDENNGVSINNMLNINSSVETLDYIGACMQMITDMNINFGLSDIYLKEFSVNDNNVYISFGLSYDNIVIFGDLDTSYTFNFEGGSLIGFTSNPIIMTEKNDYKKINQHLCLASSLNMNNVKMVVGYKVEEDVVFNPSWYTVSYTKEEGGRQ